MGAKILECPMAFYLQVLNLSLSWLSWSKESSRENFSYLRDVECVKDNKRTDRQTDSHTDMHVLIMYMFDSPFSKQT